MTTALEELILNVSSLPAVDIIIKATVAATLALVAISVTRHSRAAVRHALLTATFAILVILPLGSLFAPPVRMALPEFRQSTPPPAVTGTPSIAPPHTVTGISSTPPSPKIRASNLLLLLWLVGVAVFLLPVVLGLRRARALRRTASPWQHAQSLVDSLASSVGPRRPVQVLLHPTVPGPMTCGVIHPVILFPHHAQSWNADDLTRAVVHELEHVRRVDWLTLGLARIVCAAYWFHPLVWWSWRKLGLEAERSCDDAVLGHSEPTAYAGQLVGLARQMSLAARSPLLPMASRADLAERVNALLDSSRSRGRAGKWTVGLVSAAALALLLTLSLLRVAAAPQAAIVDVAPSQMPQFTAATMLAIVDVFASDPSGVAIEGLTKDDFSLTEDGVPQSISLFEFQQRPASTSPTVPASYYILGYYPLNQNLDGGFRKLRVIAKHNEAARLDFRLGYYSVKELPQTSASIATPDIAPPVVILKNIPPYSEAARKGKHQGTVTIQMEVDSNGSVANARIVRGLAFGLDENAIDAVKQWRFQPATKAGKPVPIEVQVAMHFRLL